MSASPVRIAIGNPNGGLVDALFAFSLAKTCLDVDNVVGYLSATSPFVHENRNVIVDLFLEGDADKLLFIDSDMAWLPRHVEALAAVPAPVVAGLCFSPRGWLQEPEPVAYTADGQPIDWRQGGLIHARYVGTGFMLLDRAILVQLRDKHGPIFDVHYRDDDAPIGLRLEGSTRTLMTEDWVLANRLAAAGIQTVVNTSVIVDHLKRMRVPTPPEATQ